MANAQEPIKQGGIVTKGDLRRVFWRSFPIQACFNYERQQHVGFAYEMIPVLRKLYPEKREAAEALSRHLEFFNTDPHIVTFITGACIAMEENNKQAQDRGESFDIDSIAALKAALMGPLAGIGDSFFWGTFRVIAAGVGCGLAAQGNVLGPILFVLLFNIPHLLGRYYGLQWGYRSGASFIESAQQSGVIETFTTCAKVIGLLVVGSMISSMVVLSTPVVLTFGDSSLELQSVFDQIFPCILPLGLTMLCYWLLRKGCKTTVLLYALLAAGILGSLVGVF